MTTIFAGIRILIFLLGLVVISAVAFVLLGFSAFLRYTVLLPISLVLAVPACIISSRSNHRKMLPDYATWFISIIGWLPAEIIPDLILYLYEPLLCWIMDNAESCSAI